MFIFGAVIFCILSAIFIFKVILPLFLKILQIEQYQRFVFNPFSIFIISLITILTSFWIYTQTVLIFSGNTEQFTNNISTLFNSDSILKNSTNGSKQATKKPVLKNEDNAGNSDLLRTGFSISQYADCLKLYQQEDYKVNNSEAIFFCQKTEKYCLSIQYLIKFSPEPNQEKKLTTGQTICKTKGWYKPFNQYSQDFNLN